MKSRTPAILMRLNIQRMSETPVMYLNQVATSLLIAAALNEDMISNIAWRRAHREK